MRYAVILVIVAALCCAGCRYGILGGAPPPYFRERMALQRQEKEPRQAKEPRAQREEEERRERRYREPEGVNFPGRAAAEFSIGALSGFKSNAIDDVRDSKTKDGVVNSFQLLYVYPSRDSRPISGFYQRYGIEMRMQSYSMELRGDVFGTGEIDIGQVHMTTVALSFKYFLLPEEYEQLGFHFSIGLGASAPSFEMSEEMEQDDLLNGRYTDISTSPEPFMAIGAGADLYLDPDLCLCLSWHCPMVGTTVRWNENGLRRNDIEWFILTNNQLTLGLRFYF